VQRDLQLPPADLREDELLELLQAAAVDHHHHVHKNKSYI
jgi:hypothetical protein